MHDGKKPCGSCAIGRDSLDSFFDKKAGRVKTKEGGEESNAEPLSAYLNESSKVDICRGDSSLKDSCGQSLMRGSLGSRLSPINKADSAHSDSIVGIVPETLQKDQYVAASNGSAQEKHDFPQGNVLISATSNLEIGSPAIEEKTTNIFPNLHGEVKQPTPLLTFSRRRKRIRNVNGIDRASEASGMRESTFSNIGHHAFHLANDGGSSGNHTACPMMSGHNSDATMVANQVCILLLQNILIVRMHDILYY